MLKIFDGKKEYIFTIAIGKVTYACHPPLAKVIKHKIASYGSVRWLWFSDSFKCWSFRYFIVNGFFFIKRINYFEKIAIVGEDPQVKIMAKMLKLLKPEKVKHFKNRDEELYDKWIKE